MAAPAPIVVPVSLDLATTAKGLRILAQAFHEMHSSLLDAATDLELLVPDKDELIAGETDPELFTRVGGDG